MEKTFPVISKATRYALAHSRVSRNTINLPSATRTLFEVLLDFAVLYFLQSSPNGPSRRRESINKPQGYMHCAVSRRRKKTALYVQLEVFATFLPEALAKMLNKSETPPLNADG